MSHNNPVASATEYGVVKVGSGLLVSGGTISAGPMPTGYYGFFLSSVSETNPIINTANPITFDTTLGSNGISVVSLTRITVANAGTYQGIFSCQLNRTAGGASTISIWGNLNGVIAPYSNVQYSISDTATSRVATTVFTATLAAGDYVQVYWSSAEITMQMLAQAAQVLPTRPATPACKFSITQV